MAADHQKFCPVPFREFRLSTTGDLSLCSPTRLKIPVVGNILKDGIEGAWNSERAVEFRRSILDGSFRYCKSEHCPALQKRSLPSAHSIQDPKYRDIIDNQRAVLSDGPLTLNLHYDVTCNLKCPTCRPAIIGLKGKDLERVLILKDMLLKSTLIDGARSLTLCGYGDPFASRPHLELLRNIDSRRFRNLRITLLTNGLLLTPQMWRTFPDAHPLIEEVAISVDAATSETYALNRGGSFERLLSNLAFVAELRRDWQIKSFRLNFVVQANNFREMPSFVELGLRFGVDRILFQKIVKSTNAGMVDFDSRAIHLTAHPDHAEFSELISRDVFSNPIVDLYTISDQLKLSDSEGIDVSIPVNDSQKVERLDTSRKSRLLLQEVHLPDPPEAAQPAPRSRTDPSADHDGIDREISALRSENERLRKDCKALKRALAIFSQHYRS